MQVQHRSIITVVTVLMSLATFGCGGGGGSSSGGGSPYISTGATGRLQDVQAIPAPGSVFIPQSTIFQVAWTPSAPPPAQFRSVLNRFIEPQSSSSNDVFPLDTTITQQGTGYLWNIQEKNGLQLDTGGVYFLELDSVTGESQLFTYIVAGGLNVSSNTSVQTVSPGTGGSLNGLSIAPAPGAAFISPRANFQLSWAGSTPPPSQFTVALHRYKQPIDGNVGSNTEQNITVTQAGPNVWLVARKDGFLLDSNAAYYLEVDAPGENPVLAAYLTSTVGP